MRISLKTTSDQSVIQNESFLSILSLNYNKLNNTKNIYIILYIMYVIIICNNSILDKNNKLL